MRRSAFAWLACAPLLVLLSIWLPVWQHYRVADVAFDSATIGRLRVSPPDDRLLAVDRQARGLRARVSERDVVQQAVSIAHGQIELPTGEIQHVTLPFDARDFEAGTPSGSLNMASLIVPDTLLSAYEATGGEIYFTQAKQAILAFGAFERGLWTDLGNVRNDHAIVARVGVLIRFWRLYRKRSDFDHDVAREVLQQMTRCVAYLGKRSHFTAATNHGVMQNIGLLQAAAAFPDSPDAPVWREIASSRLRQQMAFYVNDEGVVLEDGPGYHRFGITLIGMVLQLSEWNKLPEIDGLSQKYARGLVFLDRLARPDGSVPRIGDTDGAIVPDGLLGLYPVPPSVSERSLNLADATYLYPAAGYAITKRALSEQGGVPRSVSHATAYWSHFPGHGHDIAAEGSFVLWAAGTDWLCNTGYWPYGVAGRTEATGWRGSNAPHLSGEAGDSARTSALLSYGADRSSHLLDLVRTLERGPRLRRQVVQVDDTSWLVLDSVSAPINEAVDRLWTLAPSLTVADDEANGVVTAKDSSTGWALTMSFQGEMPPVIRKLRGSLDPFGGWVVTGAHPLPSQSYEVAQKPGSRWLVTFIRLTSPDGVREAAKPLLDFRAEDDWSASLRGAGENMLTIRRLHDRLSINESREAVREIELLSPPTALLAENDAIQVALAQTSQAFRRFRAYLFYRQRLSVAVIATALILIALALGIGRRWRPLQAPLTTLAIVFWIAAGAWIHWVYLAQ
jgi:hypothetical protein